MWVAANTPLTKLLAGSIYYMSDDILFEWNAQKALSNLQKHGVSFEFAIGVFCDHFAVEIQDNRADYGEQRINRLGLCDNVILHVTYTQRHEKIRLISARRAAQHERDYYYRQNTAERRNS